ncbi:MAG: T9SS type A sorting domain-containing protein, partial [Planctomycetia bacterium]|nr:T9SS type A sorting domain-containing protein [Planctomycetia bacterium]
QLFMEEVVVVDQNNIPMHTELFESNVYIGTPDAIYSIGDVNESSRTITIDLENTAPVYVTELDLADVPDGIQITNVAPTGRFNGSVDGQSGETEDGIGYILAYDLANGIAVGSGPILEISYDIRMDTGLFGDVITWLSSVSSADANLNAIPSSGGGFAILDANLNVETDILTPIKFSLHPAFPNPFNPTTNIRYDLPHASYVVLRVFDLAGREIRTLARGFDLSGSKSVVWDGRDNHGRNVSAGVYIYRLEASGLVESQKMVLLK